MCELPAMSANRPAVFGRAIGNTHPFEREWMGRSWVFAHNGKLPGLHEKHPRRRGRFQPMGGTDSELAFCRILDAIARGAGRKRDFAPTDLVETLEPVVDELASFGEFNFILSDGDCLYVHAHTNLHVFKRTLSAADADFRMTLLATAPLPTEPWHAMAPGSLHVYRHGDEIRRRRHSTPPEYRSASKDALMNAARFTGGSGAPEASNRTC